jgi:UDP-N-acetyl-2-amino-2-deoxyglucuronate dehydrogenase
MNNQDKIRFAMMGCGRIGHRHVQMLRQLPRTELVAAIDLKSYAELDLPPGLPLFHSFEDFIQSGIKADVITIATPNGLHAEQAICCLDKGFHVLVEKPLALQTKDAQRIVEKSVATGKFVFPVMQNRYAKAALWLKQLLNSGSLGEIFLVQVNCFWNRDVEYYAGHEWHGKKQLDGGPLFTQFAHYVDMLYWLFGDMENIQGRLANYAHEGVTEFEDTGILHFDFAKGGMGTLNYTTAVWGQNLESSLTVVAEKGSIKVSGQYLQQVEYCNVKDVNLPNILCQKLDEKTIRSLAFDQHCCVIRHAVEVLQRGVCSESTVEEGVKVVDIIERMNSQLKFSGRKSVV